MAGPREPSGEAFREPRLQGQHIYLRPLAPEDYSTLQRFDSSEAGVRWRFRGSTPSPEQWVQMAWNSVLAQFVVARRRDGRALGLVVVYRPNFQYRHAYFAAVTFGSSSSPLMVFGCALLFEYAFTCWDFHKLYFELPEYNLSQFGSGLGRYFELEGRLREHSYYAGRQWDELILALYRENWLERGKRLLAAEAAGKPRISRIYMPGRGEVWRQ